MPIRMTYTRAPANLAALCDEVTANREVVIIQRRGTEDVAPAAAQELGGLLETAPPLAVSGQYRAALDSTGSRPTPHAFPAAS